MHHLTPLRAFVRLVELSTFTAVARELRVKQSTVSKWIAALEDELGVTLVERTTRALRITEAGERFYGRAVQVLEAYDAAIAEVRDGEGAVVGRIRMSAPVVFGEKYIVPGVSSFLHEHPDVNLELSFADHYVGLVEEGFDIAVRVGLAVDSTLRSHPLGVTRRQLVASPDYLAHHPPPAVPTDLERHECLLHTALDTRSVWHFTRGDQSHRVSVRGRVATNHSASTLRLCESGHGIALLADWLVQPALEAGRLIALLPDHTPPDAPICALTPPGRFVPPRVRTLINHLRASLAIALEANDLGSDGPGSSR